MALVDYIIRNTDRGADNYVHMTFPLLVELPANLCL